MRVNLKSEKGAITLVVLVAMLFLMAVLMNIYIRTANKAQTSAETTKQISEKYNNIGEAEDIYNSYFANTDVIPIYTREQLEKIASGEQVTINGKIYTFSANAYYTLKNDLDLGGIYDEDTGTWSGDEWTPLTSDFTGTLDGLGHTIGGIYLGENEGTEGIFQELNGTVKNLYIKNSYKIKNMNGLIAGTNNGEIVNCYYEKVLIGIKAGDYVNYTPTAGTYTVAGEENGSGYSENQTFTTEIKDASLDWRIWSIDEKTGEIELVSATTAQATTPIYFKGAAGYNHAVDILNDLCEKLYSNESGATARSINVEDINEKTTYDYKEYINSETGYKYGDTKQLSTYGTRFMKCPNIYIQEIGYGTAGVFNTTGLKVSEGLNDGVTDENGVTTYNTVTGKTDGNTEGTDPYITNNEYEYYTANYIADLGVNTINFELIKTGQGYFLASRLVNPGSDRAWFVIRKVNSGGTVNDIGGFITSTGTELENGYSVRPIVLLKNVILTKDTTNSTETITYWNIEY